MASEETFFKTLRRSFSSFRFTSQKLAARLSSQFEHSSMPCLISEEDLEKLKSRLDVVRSTVQSAEELPPTDAFDQHCMRELRDLQHCAEDLLEEIEFASVRAARLEEFNFELLESKDAKRKRQEVCLLFSSYPSESFDLKIGRMMKRYDEIAFDRRYLRLTEEDGLRCGSSLKQIPTSSLTTGELYGREEDFNYILNLLISENQIDEPLNLISIMGMPGVGKTTLVQHLYHDPRVQNHFDYCIWICSSWDFDAKKITRSIMQGCGGDTRDLDEFSLLQNALLNHMSGKSLLLVLDDVWIGNKTDDCAEPEAMAKANWELLRTSLIRTGKQCKVVVTSQNVKVVNIMGLNSNFNQVHELSSLSDEHCWLICKNRAFNGRNTSTCSFLTPIGEEIVKKKCKGLPLAAKAVGDFLYLAGADGEKWHDVLCGDSGSSDDLLNEILSSLKVVYDRLSSYWKRCFAYCSLFPKGYEFEKEQLVRVWIGQGFVKPHRVLKPEEVGRQYFEELVGRFLFQKLPTCGHDKVERYVMHDLLHELVQSIAHEECRRIEGYKLSDLHEKTRHLSLVPPCLDLEKTIECHLLNEKDLRTFLFIGSRDCKLETQLFHMNLPGNAFSLMKCLRALDLSNTDIKELPSSMDYLIHLRYLVLKKTKLERLPESICGLFKLETLDLKDCDHFIELPWGIKHLFNLRHLELPKPNRSNFYIPHGIGQLTTLTNLPVFFVASGLESCGIGELRNLIHLENELHILGLHNINDEKEFERANFGNKAKLQKLTLEWSTPTPTPTPTPSLILEELKPHKNLKELEIICFSGDKLPNWVENLPQLHTLTVRQCNKLNFLPQLNSVKILNVLYCEELCELPILPSVVNLNLEGINNDVKKLWGLISLKKLSMIKCPMLRFPLDYQLPLSLQYVHIGIGCPSISQWIPHCFEKDASCDKDCHNLIRRKQGITDPQCALPS